MTIAVRRTLFLIVGALFTLAVVIAAAASSDNQAHATGPTKTVHVKQASLSQTCGDQAIAGAHFVINQIAAADQPSSINVMLANGSTVTVLYVGRLTNGTVFDDAFARNQPIQFRIGANQVIPGFEQGIVGMRVGGRRRITIPPDLAYGSQGRPPAIPPNATLVFEVELTAVQ